MLRTSDGEAEVYLSLVMEFVGVLLSNVGRQVFKITDSYDAAWVRALVSSRCF